MNDKKFHELLENEKRLYSEVESLKLERDHLMESHSEGVEQERYAWKSKMGDLEERLRE
jgi:FtsZ-binding cell division protein ZapB